MRLVNKTDWNTDDLRRLSFAVIKHYGSHKKHEITVKANKKRYSGRAWLNSTRIIMKVPPTTKRIIRKDADGNVVWRTVHRKHYLPRNRPVFDRQPREFDVHDYADVLYHEISHNFGLKHKDGLGCHSKPIPGFNYAAFSVRTKEPRPTPDKRSKLARATTMLKRALTREKRAVTLRKKWEKKVKSISYNTTKHK